MFLGGVIVSNIEDGGVWFYSLSVLLASYYSAIGRVMSIAWWGGVDVVFTGARGWWYRRRMCFCLIIDRMEVLHDGRNVGSVKYLDVCLFEKGVLGDHRKVDRSINHGYVEVDAWE